MVAKRPKAEFARNCRVFVVVRIMCSPIQTFNELLKPYMNEAEMMAMVAKSEEFEQVKVSILWLGVSILLLGVSNPICNLAQ